MSEFEKMVNGEDFDGRDPEITSLRNNAAALKQQINNNPGDALQELMQQLLGSFGEGSIVTPPFLCEFGRTIHIGSNTFLNMGVTMLDNTEIRIGDNVLIGPNTPVLYSDSLAGLSEPTTLGDDLQAPSPLKTTYGLVAKW